MASVQLAAYQGRTAKLTVVESSYSITDNTSTLTWTLEVLGGSSNYYNMYNLQAIVNGTTVYGPTTKEWSTQAFPAARGTKTGTVIINHNADGSHADVGFTLKGKVFNSGTETYNGTVSLTTIPRASSVSIASSVTTNSSYTITITPAADNTFSHIIEYSFKGLTGTINTLNTGTNSTSWTVPRSLANKLPSSTESSAGELVITCKTYNGNTRNDSTYVGSKTCSSKVIVDSGLVPTLATPAIQDGNATVRGKNWGVYLQNMSYVNITSMTGTGSYSSSISRYCATFEGTNYDSDSISGLNSQLQAKGLPTTGSRSVTLWVKDSRGRTSSTKTASYTVVAYESPKINSYDAYRTNSSGTAATDGTYFKYFFNCSISSCSSHNPMTVKIRWRKKGASSDTGSSTPKSATTSESSYNSNAVLGSNAITTADTWEIIFEVTDGFSTNSRTKDVPPAFELFHFHASGKAVAFGKKSTAGSSENLFEVGMPAIIDRILSPAGRVTSLDIEHTYPHSRVSTQLNISSSSVTADNPGDGYVQTYFWDNSGAYDTQFYLPDSSSVRPKIRNKGAANSWSGIAWREFVLMSDISNMAKTETHQNLLASGNEFTFVGSGYSGSIWFNYRTAGGTNGNITEYFFGNGKGGSLGTAIHSGNFRNQIPAATTSASGLMSASDKSALNNISSVTTGDSVVTKSSGSCTLLSSTYAKYGNVVHLNIRIKATAQVNVGSNVFTGTISNTSLRPRYEAVGAGYNGSTSFLSAISTDGGVTIRVLGANCTSGKEMGIQYTYIV